jgi:hypothetical protein
MPICSKCGMGFDVVEGGVSACPKCGTGWAPGSGSASGSAIGDFFLTVGVVICFLGCVFAVLKTLYGLWTLNQVASLIHVTTEYSVLLIGVILLDGFVWFFLSAALVVVFLRVLQR